MTLPPTPPTRFPPEDIPGSPEWIAERQRDMDALVQHTIDTATEEDWRRGREATEEEVEEVKARAYRALLAQIGEARAYSGGYTGKFDDP